MEILFDGEVDVHYGQAYVESGDGEGVALERAFGGQANGLCGAAEPGCLFLITGLHTGHVGFRIERHDGPPPIDEAWEEIVEVSFEPRSPQVFLTEWGSGDGRPLYLPSIAYRVRYCAYGMDAGHQVDTRMDDEPQVDRYLLQFWPAPPSADRVVKQTSENAAYWHTVPATLPPPPTPEEKAEAERRRERAAEEEAYERSRWQGELPSDPLRKVGGNVIGMVRLDRDLAETVAAAGPDRQRRIARWAARRAYAIAGLDTIDWIAPALEAMDDDRPLPSPFDDQQRTWDRLWADDRVPQTTVTLPDGVTHNALQQAFALPALFGAVERDPLQAALDALFAAAYAFGLGYRDLLQEARAVL